MQVANIYNEGFLKYPEFYRKLLEAGISVFRIGAGQYFILYSGFTFL